MVHKKGKKDKIIIETGARNQQKTQETKTSKQTKTKEIKEKRVQENYRYINATQVPVSIKNSRIYLHDWVGLFLRGGEGAAHRSNVGVVPGIVVHKDGPVGHGRHLF